jgi:hypothetical protein
MAAPSFYQMPHSVQAKPASLVCPNCSLPFDSSDAVVQHLSSPGLCGQWLTQTLPNIESEDTRPEDDYIDDPEAAQDGMP